MLDELDIGALDLEHAPRLLQEADELAREDVARKVERRRAGEGARDGLGELGGVRGGECYLDRVWLAGEGSNEEEGCE